MITVDWLTNVFTIPQSFMTPLGGDIYELDINAARLEIGQIMASEQGIVFPDSIFHEAESLLSGTLYARKVTMRTPYSLFISPATPYQVSCIGANHNFQDVYTNLTGPTLLPNNSAGLIKVETGVSGLTAGESAQLQAAADTLPGIEADIAVISASIIAIESDIATIQTDVGFIRVDQALMRKVLQNRKITHKSGPNAGKMVIYDDDDVTVLLEAQIWQDEAGSIPYAGTGLERQDRLDTP